MTLDNGSSEYTTVPGLLTARGAPLPSDMTAPIQASPGQQKPNLTATINHQRDLSPVE